MSDKKLSYKSLERQLEATNEVIAEKNAKMSELEADKHRHIHLLLKLYASKCPDICEHFIDCSIRNMNCIEGDNPLRRACKEVIRKAQLKVVNGKQ